MSGAEFLVLGNNAIQGSERYDGPIAKTAHSDRETRQYFYVEFSRPFRSYQTWQDRNLSQAAKQKGDCIGFVTDSPSSAGESVEVRVGISYISTDQARSNLEREIPG